MALDTTHTVQTPEGVDLDLRVAGPVTRCVAWGLDVMLRLAVWFALFMLTSFMFNGVSAGVFLIYTFVSEWFYPVLFEVLQNGQTPGKRAMGLRVIREDGTPVDWSSSVLRNFLRVVDLLPALYGVGLVSTLIDPSFRRVGDLAAGTLVVYAGSAGSSAGTIPAARPLPPPIPLQLEEQRAVVAFAERSPFLTDERADELASIPTMLVGAENPRVRLFRIAAHLVGRESGSGQ